MLSEAKNNSSNFSTKNLIIGGAVALAAALGYYFFKTQEPKTTPKVESKPSPALVEPVEESSEKALIRVINSIKRLVIDKNNLTSQAIKAIYRSQFQLSKKQFRQLTLKNREERRKVFGDLKKYFELVQTYEEDLDELHNKHLNAVLAHFKLDKAEWILIVDQMGESSEKEDWDNFLIEAETEEIDVIRKKDMPKVKPEILISISKLKAKKLQENNTMFSEMTDIQKSDLLILIEKWIQDIIYQTYKMEVEDINFSSKDLNQDQRNELEENQDHYKELLQTLVLGDEELFEEEGDF